MKKKVLNHYQYKSMISTYNRAHREDAPTAEQLEFLEKVKSATKAEVDLKVKELTDKFAALEGKEKESAEIITALKNNLATIEAQYKAFKEQGGNNTPVHNTIKEQIKKAYKANEQALKDFKSKATKSFEFELDLKAATTMLESTNLNSSSYIPKPDIRPGFIDLVRNIPLIEQYANGGATSSELMVWVNKYNAQGTSAMTAEGNALPLISNQVLTENTTAVLEGAYITISIQMLDDIDFMASMIEGELRYKVDIQVDNDLISGSGAGGNLKGITTYATQYTSSAITTTNANDQDCIRAVIGQMRSLNFYPNLVFINPLDGANMDLVKDLYLYKDGNDTMFRLKVIESPQITQGYFLVADMSKFFVFNYLPFTVQYGWINDNLIRNLITVTGIRRLHSYVSINHYNGIQYNSFATVKLALAPTP